MHNTSTVTPSAARKATVQIQIYVSKVKNQWTIRVTVATNAVHPAASRIAAHCHFNVTKLARKTQTARRRGSTRALAVVAKAIVVPFRYAMVTKN